MGHTEQDWLSDGSQKRPDAQRRPQAEDEQQVTFRCRVEVVGVVVPIECLKRTGSFRPVQLYRLN